MAEVEANVLIMLSYYQAETQRSPFFLPSCLIAIGGNPCPRLSDLLCLDQRGREGIRAYALS